MATPKYQFKRTYELIIGKPDSGEGLRIVGDEDKNEGLNIKFRIKKFLDNKENDNKTEIKITNLSESSINYIKKEDMSLILKVGYGGDNKLVFTGNISEVETDNPKGKETDRETTIRCVPSAVISYVPDLSRSFPPNSTPRDILNFIVRQSTGISKSSFNSENIDKPFPFGYPIEGTPRQVLNTLATDFDFTYRIDGGRLSVSDPNEYEAPNSKSRATLISPDTGLKGTPTYASPDGKKIKNAETKKNGVKFKALLNPLLQPGHAVKLADTEITGVYRINTVEMVGDWRRGDWEVNCWCAFI